MKRIVCARMAVPLCGLIFAAVSNCLAESPGNASVSTDPDPLALRDVTITSSADGSDQHAMFWAPQDQAGPVPLLVDLHTWSGDYRQDDPRDDFFRCAQRRGWAFIHPDFRGPNVRPEACASDLAVADVLDAVEYAKREADIDENRVYLVGVSGGGHMALLMAGRSPQTWAGVSAWVPISDLTTWYVQNCKDGEPGQYAGHLEQVCGGAPGASEAVDQEYRRRSPVSYLQQAAGLPIDINAGIHDGHSGSVPISQSLLAFNVLADANDLPDQRIPDEVIEELLVRRLPAGYAYEPDQQDSPRRYPILFRRVAGPVRVTIFDGGHQHDTEPAIRWLAEKSK